MPRTLIGIYVCSVLRNLRHGLGFTAALMILTRRVNWFDLEKAAPASPELSAAP